MNANLRLIRNPHLVAALSQPVTRIDLTFAQEKLLSDNRELYIEQSKRTEDGKVYPFDWLRIARS